MASILEKFGIVLEDCDFVEIAEPKPVVEQRFEQKEHLKDEPNPELRESIESEKDELLDLLLSELSFADIQTALLANDQGTVFLQLARVWKTLVALASDLLSGPTNKKESDFSKLLSIFLETYHTFTYSQKRVETEVLVRLTYDATILDQLWEQLPLLKCKDMLYRFLVFLLVDTKPFVKSLSTEQAIHRLLTHYTASKPDQPAAQLTLGLAYLADHVYAENNSAFRQVVRDLFEQLVSALNGATNADTVTLAKLLNLLFQGRFSVILKDLNVGYRLYEQLRRLSPTFSLTPSWASDSRLVDYVVNLIKLNIGRVGTDQQLTRLIANDFLFLVQKQSNCRLLKEIIPSLLTTTQQSYKIYTLHNQQSSDPLRLAKPKAKQLDSVFEFHSEKLSAEQRKTLFKTIVPQLQLKKKPDNLEWEWSNLLSYTFDSPASSIEPFKALTTKQHVMFIFQLSSSKGTVEVVMNLSDKFVLSNYAAQTYHTFTEKEFNVEGKMITSRSNDESYIFMFDGTNEKVIPSNTKLNSDKRHPPNVKVSLEILASGLNAYVDGTRIATISFQDPNANLFSLVGGPAANENEELILMNLEVWGLQQTKKKLSANSGPLTIAQIQDFRNSSRQLTQEIISDFEQYYYLDEVVVADKLPAYPVIGQAFSAINLAITADPLSLAAETVRYALAQPLIEENLLTELLHSLLLLCNDRANVQIFLIDCYTMVQVPEWPARVLTKLNGKWAYFLAYMAVMERETTIETHKVFHQTVLSAYEALAQCDIAQLNAYNLFQLLLNRIQVYANTNLSLKLTQEQKKEQAANAEKKPKAVAKKVVQTPATTVGKPKGVGYGDVSSTNLIIKDDKVQQSKALPDGYESDRIYQSLADDYRWDVIKVLLKCFSGYLRDRNVDVALHQQLKYSCLPSVVFWLLKSYGVSEVLSSEKMPTFQMLLTLIDSLAQHIEYGDILVDKEYGGQDSDRSIYDLLKKLNEEGQFFGETSKSSAKLSTIATEKEQQQREKQDKQDRFLKLLEKTFTNVEQSLEQGQFISVSYEDVSSASVDGDINYNQFYNSLMKQHILDSCTIVDQSGFLAQMGNYFNAGTAPSQTKMKRVVHELSNIASALPCESTNSIFLRYDKNHMDAMRTIIFGSSGTPYAHGAFLYNMYFCDDYPQRPPKCLLETTGHGKVRFNPNLYNCGKVCLSLLGTWGDNWIPNVSTLLQILVSIQSMVMSEYVYFNEPGWEHSMGTPEGDQRNRGYCNIVKLANIRYAMIEAIREPAAGFEEVIHKSFYLRKDVILKEVKGWIEEADLPVDYQGSQNHNISNPFQQDPTKFKSVLKSEIAELEKELEKLKLKVQGTLKLGGSGEKKKIVQINHKRMSKLYAKEQRAKALQQKKREVTELFETPLVPVDVSYDEAVTKKQFNVNSSEVQSLMSRYIGVMGIESVQKQSQASVFLYGLSPVGVEVAKNLILSGLKRISIVDVKRDQYPIDGQFYMTEPTNRLQQNLGKLSHLNPYVQIDSADAAARDILKQETGIFHVSNYNIVVICDYVDYDDVIDIANTCRAQGVPVILGESAGIYGRVLVDLGDNFTVYDKDGEATVEIKLDSIDADGLVTIAKPQKHSLQDGDVVAFKEIVSEGQKRDFNEHEFTIKVVSRTQFSIGPLDEYNTYVRNGIAITRKQKVVVNNHPLVQALKASVRWDDTMAMLFLNSDIIKRDVAQLLFDGLSQYKSQTKRDTLTLEDAAPLFEVILGLKEWDLVRQKHPQLETEHPLYREQILQFCLTSNGYLHTQAAYLGGLISQEVIKAITHKYMPINQGYLHSLEELCVFKAKDLTPLIESVEGSFRVNSEQLVALYRTHIKDVGERYNRQNIVLGSEFLNSIHNSKLFMIGAGAIGCELLKNYAMLGLGSGSNGRIILTDPDVIEQSNLNRQFLFREKHIRKPKSTTAASAAIQMNPDLQGKITARLDKVHPGSESLYSNFFFQQLNLVTNALDNVQARLYIDARCVENAKPLVESGTLGSKGHVQVIIPFQTESYGSKRDPEEDNEIPYCTLKMFPEDSLHCLEWARDKFEKMFFAKPSSLKTVLTGLANPAALQIAQLETTLRLLKKKPKSFLDCLQYARNKFQKFFHNSVVALIKAYPLDHKDDKGKLFWSSPKRPPHTLVFDPNDESSLKFLISTAVLWAEVNNIEIEKELIEDTEKLKSLVVKIQPEQFEVDEQKLQQIQQQVKDQGKEKENDLQQEALEQASPNELIQQILQLVDEYFTYSEDLDNLNIKPKKPLDDKVLLNPIAFEKDDDANRHIDFIQAGTNCRAQNYKLEGMDWLQVKLKAGRIVPAMATTTSCISALQTIEAIKLLQSHPLSDYKNTFLNLAVPLSMQAEPGECETMVIREGVKTSFWTRWTVELDHHTSSLGGFIQHLEKLHSIKVTGIKQGGKVVYLPLMFVGKPESDLHNYFNKALTSLVDYQDSDEYVELDVSFAHEDGKEIAQPPKVRVIL